MTETDTPMLVQCGERESGGVQCEVLLTDPGEAHGHWVSDETIAANLRRPFYTHLSVSGVTTWDGTV